MSKSDNYVNGFWTKFGSVLSESGIDEEHAKFYLQWAEKFAVWLKGVPLRPSRYYLELRLYRARLLLLQTDIPIIEVAVSCGFSTAPHFSKCYSDHYGKPPRDVRLAMH